jgi:hypothetical protein
MAFTAQGSIVPLTSFMGGMVAQECLKAISGKYTPLNQWVISFSDLFLIFIRYTWMPLK